MAKKKEAKKKEAKKEPAHDWPKELAEARAKYRKERHAQTAIEMKERMAKRRVDAEIRAEPSRIKIAEALERRKQRYAASVKAAQEADAERAAGADGA